MPELLEVVVARGRGQRERLTEEYALTLPIIDHPQRCIAYSSRRNSCAGGKSRRGRQWWWCASLSSSLLSRSQNSTEVRRAISPRGLARAPIRLNMHVLRRAPLFWPPNVATGGSYTYMYQIQYDSTVFTITRFRRSILSILHRTAETKQTGGYHKEAPNCLCAARLYHHQASDLMGIAICSTSRSIRSF